MTDRIIRRIKRVQFLLEQGNTLPWFLVKEGVPLAVTAGADPAIPDDFLREIEYNNGLSFQADADSAPVFVQKIGYDEGLARYATLEDGDYPRAYAIRKDTFRIFPRTTQNITLNFDYYAADVVLDNNVENAWLANSPYLIIGNSGASMAATLRNQGAVQEFSQLAEIAWQKILRENALRVTANRRFILGRNS